MESSPERSYEWSPDGLLDPLEGPRPQRGSGGAPIVEPRAVLPGPSARDLLCPLRRAIDLHLRGDFEGAERRLRAVLALDPSLPQAHHHLAVVLHSCGRPVEALRHLTLAIEIDPNLVGAQDRLGLYRAELAASREAVLGSDRDDGSSQDAA